MAGQPGARHLRGDAATLETLCPVVGPGGDFAVKLVLPNGARQLKSAHKAWRVDQHIALGVEVQAVARLDARADQNVFHVARIRHQVSAGARLDLQARGHKALPRLGQFGLGHARLLQYVGAVQQGAWANVGGRRHHGTALGGALLVGKRNVAGLVLPNQVGRLGQVFKTTGAGKSTQAAEFERDHVGQVGARGQGRGHGRVVVLHLAADEANLHIRVQFVPAGDGAFDDLVHRRVGRYRQGLTLGLRQAASQQACRQPKCLACDSDGPETGHARFLFKK